ncbi:mitochondrial N(5)-glutamine methyltransferase MTQ1 [Plectosphaerella plurivora]|uniref:Mitochondrial N(5)-glutamine methyltransferase MTQ1 n=1 Tax=Plectosphaerella plurivora TaxID=936078 RepID=A0A9P8VBB5_9PEZI|nr:mitochondrial N(5)-glutamine methyltransferase MTQ1 [Plectosphaerella plurivora]
MPRLAPSLLRRAHRISPLLRTLLPATRNIPSAQNELRWIREHARSSPAKPGEKLGPQNSSPDRLEKDVARMCRQRGQGVPLQYVLGSQPFGRLEIACEKGILVPRQETEAWAEYLREYILQCRVEMGETASDLGIVDFCTGTGCIALSLFQGLQCTIANLRVRGVDISPQAVSLAKRNLDDNLQTNIIAPPKKDQNVTFTLGNVFDDAFVEKLKSEPGSWDVLVSNPPYVSRDTWTHGRGEMGFSVKKYEPRLALVPGDDVPSYPGVKHEDVFYWRLLDVAEMLDTRLIVFEVGDLQQAYRVARMSAFERPWSNLRDWEMEIWRDSPKIQPQEDEEPFIFVHKKDDEVPSRVLVRGSGNVRCVVFKKHIHP